MNVRHPARWAYAAGIAGIVANLLLIGFYAFQLGRPETGVSLGSANDLVGAVASALMIPVAVARGGLLPRGRGTRVVQAGGIAAMAILAVTGPLLVFGALSFEVQLPIAMAAALVLFGWVVLVSRALRSVPAWSRPVARFGRVVGAVALIGALVIVGGLLLPWGSTPQLIVMGIGGSVGLVGWLGIPVWFLLVGRQFARAAGKRTARLATSVDAKSGRAMAAAQVSKEEQ